LKLSSGEMGSIYGSLSWDDKAGSDNNYLITNEITMDLTDFIYPA